MQYVLYACMYSMSSLSTERVLVQYMHSSLCAAVAYHKLRPCGCLIPNNALHVHVEYNVF